VKLAVVIALVLSACAVPDDNGSHRVEGTPADVTTPAGDYTGYRVVTACNDDVTAVGVIGTGTTTVPTDSRISAAASDLMTQLEDLPSVWHVDGPGAVCGPGVGITIEIYDWRDVDTVIGRTAAWLVEHGYDVRVGIRVAPKPGHVYG
jgi:hypothetical protein